MGFFDIPNLTVYVDSSFLVLFSNWSTLKSKGSKIKLSLILTKIEILGFFDMLNPKMYLDFLLWAQFSSWSKSGSKIIILSIVQQQEIFNCTVLHNSKKYLIAQYCAIARNSNWISIGVIFLCPEQQLNQLKSLFYTIYNVYSLLLPTDKLKQSLPFSDNNHLLLHFNIL